MFRSTQTIITQPLQNFHCIPPYSERIVTVAWWWCEQIETFYICSSVHRNSSFKKSNKVQQYADIYLLLNYSTCFGRHRAHHQECIKLLLQPLVQKLASQTVWSVPEAATTVLCTPDDGRDGRQKHVE